MDPQQVVIEARKASNEEFAELLEATRAKKREIEARVFRGKAPVAVLREINDLLQDLEGPVARERARGTVRIAQTATRELKAEAQRQEILRAPLAAGRAPLVERQRGASRERRSARSSARSGDSGDSSDSGPSSSDPDLARRRRASRRARGRPP